MAWNAAKTSAVMLPPRGREPADASGCGVPASLAAVLQNLRWVFTVPSFATFAALATGLIANTGVGTVTGARPGEVVPHDRAHAFFARAAWKPDTLGLYLSRLIVRTLLPDGAALLREEGVRRCVAARRCCAWTASGRVRGLLRRGRDRCRAAFCTRPFCLPVAARMWRPKTGPSEVEIAAALVKQLAAWHRDRRIGVEPFGPDSTVGL